MPELEQAILTRVNAISDGSRGLDPAYLDSLCTAVGEAIDYGLEAIERGGEWAPPVPTVLLAQARLAARSGIGLETVLRRYFSGHALLNDFLVEAADGILEGEALKQLLRAQAALFEGLLALVSEEHAREASRQATSPTQRRAARVRRLLDGELLEPADLAYDFDAIHVGLIAAGPAAPEALRAVAGEFDRRALLIRPDAEAAWLWLGGRTRLAAGEVLERAQKHVAPPLALAIGEAARGLAGWRLSHRQAAAALPLVRTNQGTPVRYADVALLASMARDDLLIATLRQLYLEPLNRERDGGRKLKETLRAYFAADRSVSSAAAALGVNRNTVASRLRTVEARIERPLDSCTAELNAVLRLEQLGKASLRS